MKKKNKLPVKAKTVKPKIKKEKLPVKVIEMQGITKTFNEGKIIANHKMNLVVKRNEIHAIVGENGAGKTTLMSILFGIYKPDSGTIKINGKSVKFKSANDASKVGLGMVHQHFKLVPCYTLLENIMLGVEKTKFGFLRKADTEKEIRELSRKYKLPVTLWHTAEKASVGEQQRCEIMKLLYRNNDILIFDEPTAVLSDREIEGFLSLLKNFKRRGKTIIIITHKLDEIRKVADRATIIRNGENVRTVNVKTTPNEKISSLMIGKKLNPFIVHKPNKSKRKTLEIKKLTIAREGQKNILAIKDFSFDARRGEIIGIAGIEGNGQSELALAIGGLMKPKAGEITFNKGVKKYQLNKLSVRRIYKLGISHVPEDRHKHGIILDETVAYNCVLPEIDSPKFSRFGFLKAKRIKKYAIDLCNKWDVHGINAGEAHIRALSGGNQQKLVLAREIARQHSLIVLVQPTRGLDVGAINNIHKEIIKDAKKGATVILISYELDEIMNLAHRLVVMDRGKIVYDVPREKADRITIGEYLSRTARGGFHA